MKKKEKKGEVVVNESEITKSKWTKESFKQFIDAYKAQNPVRYERVKEELDKQLSTL